MSTRAHFSQAELNDLSTTLSNARLSTYRRFTGGDEHEALELYQWNMALSSAFLIPMHLAEVALRNAIAGALNTIHGLNWTDTTGFEVTLQNPVAPAYSARRDLIACRRRHRSVGKIVADLRFVFWEKMLLKGQQSIVWDTQFFSVFPHAEKQISANSNRERLRKKVERVRQLRNRVAHHEPIFSRPLRQDLAAIMAIIDLRSPAASRWARHVETVTALLNNPPKSGLYL